MSDPEVPQPERPKDVNDVVDSANAGLADAAAAGAEVPGERDSADRDAAGENAVDRETFDRETFDRESADRNAVDPDLAAFEEAEKSHPGTFATPEFNESTESVDQRAVDQRAVDQRAVDQRAVDQRADDRAYADDRGAGSAATTGLFAADQASTSDTDARREDSIADTAYLPPVADDSETRVVPSEPAVVVAPVTQQQQPIFVQAPEPPRDRGNRAAAAGIGLLATLVFAILYLATALGLGALAGDVTGENIGEAALAPLMTWGFWVPVVVFFIGFCLLGAVINRGRWGLWVVFGIIVGLFAYAGHILGQLFEAPFWLISTSEGNELVGDQLLAPLAIAAFVFGRELTIWFGAWVARSGARKTELNIEAQREYERTLEAGPTLSR
ncbi:ABC transporter [Microbacterium profundi]|uniref:ABC transporter n=1 Tax=Microbacterium profundi TaxID=450380 RepID=UPI001F44203E|nr:ABC transporter [Microbacterium profundi]MCE7483094.1 ABC transporter [Microbacterium profundi]